jgi:hypothetical protein
VIHLPGVLPRTQLFTLSRVVNIRTLRVIITNLHCRALTQQNAHATPPVTSPQKQPPQRGLSVRAPVARNPHVLRVARRGAGKGRAEARGSGGLSVMYPSVSCASVMGAAASDIMNQTLQGLRPCLGAGRPLNDERPGFPGLSISSLPVGVTGFEPATSSSRTKRATKLRHTPVPERSLSDEPPLV